ncbi:hypothetical protein Ciccas_002443 [Cichlidogyrus casuarinus]|uniref:PDZ domain-containing protein n=1 Tax=Cichlidogyrus casuarinus TaxID=1844966 RepID=A0ABD2QJF7_9PLAT
MSYVDVFIKRNCRRDLGFSISGGCDRVSGNSAIFVSDVIENSPVQGKLHVGDVIISINGTSLLDSSHERAVYLLKSASEDIFLKVLRQKSE